MFSLMPFMWRLAHPSISGSPADDSYEDGENYDLVDGVPRQMPKLPPGALIHYSVPGACNKAEHECKHVASCYEHKWQTIPSCRKAAKKCSELPIAQQELMPFCKSCIVSWRKMSSCGTEVNDCAKWRESCYKARLRERTQYCLSDGISPGTPLGQVNETEVTNACAASLRVEALTHHLSILARKLSDLPPPPPPGKGKKGKLGPLRLTNPPEPPMKPKYIDLEY